MARTNGFAVHFTISDCGAHVAVEDYCYPMLMGSAALIKAPGDALRSDYPGLLAENLQASFFPDLVSGTTLGLIFPLLIHLTDIQSGPVYPWSQPGPLQAVPVSPYAPSPYSLTGPPAAPTGRPLHGPWCQNPLDRYPCPRPGGAKARVPAAGEPEVVVT